MGSLFDTPAFNERLFFPRSETTVPPPGATDLVVRVDGAELHVRVHPARPGAPTVLLFHGNGEVVADYDGAAEAFAACGAKLAVADFRGYGQSTGTPTLRRAIADAAPVLEAVLGAGSRPVIVMGRSLGSVCAAELYPRAEGPVVGFVWESGIADLHALVRRRGLTPPARIAPNDLAVFDPLAKLRRGDRPLLVLHGAGDSLIAPDEARQAFDAASASRKELIYVPNRGHNDLSLDPAYWDALRRFVSALVA